MNSSNQMPTPFRPVILCGGSGTRLWPLSRAGFPKQFLCLTSNQTLFQEALKRLLTLKNAKPPLIVCNDEHRFLVQGQLDELATQEIELASLIHSAQLLLEPEGRNTAPALTLAALATLETHDETSLMVVTPADQIIQDPKAFHKSIQLALEAARNDAIVTLGVIPNRPETGYGYMKVDKAQAHITCKDGAKPEAPAPFEVLAFTEKPSTDTAVSYLNEGGYFWNAGMFILKAEVWLSALHTHRPDILKITQESWNRRAIDDAHGKGKEQRARFIRPDKTAFLQNASESIDYAVMEPSACSEQSLKLIPLGGGWSDLGAWDAVWEALPKDKHGNSHRGDVLNSGCENTFVHANSRLVSLIGMKDLVVVETSDAVLVTNHKNSQNVKSIVETLRASKREEPELHRKVHRPWGWYDSIDEGERFKVKRIQVKPGASLSLQKHHHRAEHWIVVKGTAEITIGERVILLSENQSTYIPLGEKHRLANPGSIALEIIEVQSGSYLGEDDIVRFEDIYGRDS